MITLLKKNIWKKTILKKTASIKQAIKSLEISSTQIVLVCDEKQRLLATITDGDIRRAILKNFDIETNVEKIMNFDPVFVYEQMPQEYAYAFMKEKQLKSIPILSKSNTIKGLYILGNYFEEIKQKKIYKLSNPFFIMAGGKGLRMRPLTKNTPKPMLKINKKPMLEHIFLKAKSEGFQNFYVSINYLSAQIKRYFKDGSKLGIKITYIEEDTYLGTGGSLKYLDKKYNEPILVCNCDIITDINFRAILEFHKKKKADATMAMRVFKHNNPYGVIETRGFKLKKIIEKQSYIHKVNAGIYVLDPKVLKLIKKNQSIDITNIFHKIEHKIVYPTYEDWNDVGNIELYEKIRYSKKK